MMIGAGDNVEKHLDPIFKTIVLGGGDIPRIPGREKLGGNPMGAVLARVRQMLERWQRDCGHFEGTTRLHQEARKIR